MRRIIHFRFRSLSILAVAASLILTAGTESELSARIGAMPAPSSAGLVQATDIGYVGSFRVPTNADLNYDHSGHGLTYDPLRNSLFVSNYASRVSEISIPTPGNGTSLASLPTAALRQGPTDVLRGKRDLAGDMIGGLLVNGNSLTVSAYLLYDANHTATVSHFRVSTDFSNTTVAGPVEVGSPSKAGIVAGPMAHIPYGWQSLLGGPALTGLCCVSIISRSSYGPSATVFDPATITASTSVVPGTRVLYYPGAHPTLGDWNSSGTLWNSAASMAGMVWIDGTDSVLFFGRKGDNYCYGFGDVCGDPTSPHKGDHAYPYNYFVWAYDANDLLAVKNGQKQTWEVVPYATWSFNMPMATGHKILRGVAYDPSAQRIFLAEQKADGSQVLIRVLQLGVAPAPPSPSNAMPTVQASCSPCSAEIGQSVTLNALAADADGDALSYQWSGAGGTFTSPAAAVTTFTTLAEGPATVTVTVDDGHGGRSSAAVGVSFVNSATSSPTAPPSDGGGGGGTTTPTEPTPTEPAPTEPAPTEPTPTEPAPTEPEPEPEPEPVKDPDACLTPDPYALLGGGVCVGGVWYPPGFSIPKAPDDSKESDTTGGCVTADPYVLLGGGFCAGGKWHLKKPKRNGAGGGTVAWLSVARPQPAATRS